MDTRDGNIIRCTDYVYDIMRFEYIIKHDFIIESLTEFIIDFELTLCSQVATRKTEETFYHGFYTKRYY